MFQAIKDWWQKTRIEMSSSWVQTDIEEFSYISREEASGWLLATQPMYIYRNIETGEKIAISTTPALTTRKWHWDKKPESDDEKEFENKYSKVYW